VLKATQQQAQNERFIAKIALGTQVATLIEKSTDATVIGVHVPGHKSRSAACPFTKCQCAHIIAHNDCNCVRVASCIEAMELRVTPMPRIQQQLPKPVPVEQLPEPVPVHQLPDPPKQLAQPNYILPISMDLSQREPMEMSVPPCTILPAESTAGTSSGVQTLCNFSY
jgi:hypothetical protein